MEQDCFSRQVRQYQNTAKYNDAVFSEFTALTDSIPWLKSHRDLVEKNSWGFGYRALHYMWYLLLLEASEKFSKVDCLEIGVYKGQIISLWEKIGKECGLTLSVTGITPLEGNVRDTFWQKIRRYVDPLYRRRLRQLSSIGNLHYDADFLLIIQEVFSTFQLQFDSIDLIKGYSNDPEVVAKIENRRFHIIYIDGDHSEEIVRSDIATYAPLVLTGGYMVMDDASCFLPGTTYFKGIETVSRACEDITKYGYRNALNISHNRVFERVE